MDLFEQERLTNMQSRMELYNNITQLKSEMCHNVDQEVDGIIISQVEFTGRPKFVSFRTKLVVVVQ